LEVRQCAGQEITEGSLSCRCGRSFPIIRGVPRFLPEELRHELTKYYPDFNDCNLNAERGQRFAKTEINNIKSTTLSRFGYEWNHFLDYDCKNFKSFIAPLPTDFFKGRIGLDAGCGAGRHSKAAGELGAEMIAIDLSTAVDAAYLNNVNNERVHVVQADIYHFPIRDKSFDFIFSLGVLHHLPEPELGYRSLIPLLKEGGALFIWVYAYAVRKVALEILRFVSQRLSNDNIRRMAYLCNLVDYGVFVNFYRLLSVLPIVDYLVRNCSPPRVKEYARHGFKVGYTDWFDRLSAPISNYYKRHEMLEWLERSQLSNTRLNLVEDSWWWLYGERKAQCLIC
jgi:SAM-dependent methyltransferase